MKVCCKPVLLMLDLLTSFCMTLCCCWRMFVSISQDSLAHTNISTTMSLSWLHQH